MNQAEFLHHALSENHHALSAEIEQRILHYLNLLQDWNRVFNLTSIRDHADMVMLHILDSLAIQTYLQGTRIIDVGTGAGLPGIPLALIHPEKNFVLLDSNSKKTRFLTQAVHDLSLKNVEVVQQRAEQFHPEQLFDSILSRAFASLELMLETTQHLLNQHGQFLAMKGTYPEQEILQIPKEFKVLAVHQLTIKGLDAKRHLVCMEKERSWEK